MTIDFSTKNPASCFIELSPELDELDTWTGGLILNILTSKDSPLDTDSKAHLLNLCQLVASTVALMEEDPALAIRLDKFVNGKPKDKNITKKDNVIHYNFKTKGNK
tara:strand:- start:845 stop:1162 length:318 start_codon:yes stop_codon:yes gene_type:complete